MTFRKRVARVTKSAGRIVWAGLEQNGYLMSGVYDPDQFRRLVTRGGKANDD
jgi:hypothetical protein